MLFRERQPLCAAWAVSAVSIEAESLCTSVCRVEHQLAPGVRAIGLGLFNARSRSFQIGLLPAALPVRLGEAARSVHGHQGGL